MANRLLHIILIAWILNCGLSLTAHAVQTDDSANKVKAAFLIQFSKYIDWPEDCFKENDHSLVLSILGRDPFGSAIDLINRNFHDKKIEIRRLTMLSEIRNCHILFITPGMTGHMPEITQKAMKSPMLLIGDSDGFLNQGGMINFTRKGTKLRFDIHLDNIKKSGLKISSKLIKVANKVK
jgi:YfiR/HmsC-like